MVAVPINSDEAGRLYADEGRNHLGAIWELDERGAFIIPPSGWIEGLLLPDREYGPRCVGS